MLDLFKVQFRVLQVLLLTTDDKTVIYDSFDERIYMQTIQTVEINNYVVKMYRKPVVDMISTQARALWTFDFMIGDLHNFLCVEDRELKVQKWEDNLPPVEDKYYFMFSEGQSEGRSLEPLVQPGSFITTPDKLSIILATADMDYPPLLLKVRWINYTQRAA